MTETLGDLKIKVLLEILNADKNAKQFTSTLAGVDAQSDKTGASTVQLQSKLQNIGLRFQGLQSIVRLFKGTLGDLIASYQVQEIALAKLTNGLRNVGEGTSALNKLTTQASALQKITVYGDEEINSAQAMLTTFMKSSDEIEILTPRILDLAAAFDQSGSGGKSLQEVAVMLGKVNEETIGALRRVGVAFSKEQEEKLKSLKGTEQAIYLTEILDQNFKGMAQTVGNTTAGKMKIFQNAVGDLKEEWGKLLAEALLPFIKPLGEVVKMLQDSPPNIKAAALALGALGTAFIFLNGSLPTSAKVFGLFLTVVLALPEPLRGVAIAIGTLGVALKLLGADITSVQGLLKILTSAFPSLAGAASSAGSGIAGMFGSAGPVVAAIAIAIWWVSELISKINDAQKEAEELERYRKKVEQGTNTPAFDSNAPTQGTIDAFKKQLDLTPDATIKVDGKDLKLKEYVSQLEAAKQKSEQFGKTWEKMTGQVNTKFEEQKRSSKELGDKLEALNASLSEMKPDDPNLLTIRSQRDALKKEKENVDAIINPPSTNKSGPGANEKKTKEVVITNELIDKEEELLELLKKEATFTADQKTQLVYLNYLEKVRDLKRTIAGLQIPIPEIDAMSKIGFETLGLDGKRLPIDSLTPVKDKEVKKKKAPAKDFLDAGLAAAMQINSILGLGADNFVGKLLNGLQSGISLVGSIAKILSLFGSGGVTGIFSLLGFASGGSVPGSGSGDTVPAMLTPGEFVINRSRADQLGSRFLNWLNGGGTVQSMAPGAFANIGGGAQIIQVPYIISHDVKGQDLRTTLTRVDKVNSRRTL